MRSQRGYTVERSAIRSLGNPAFKGGLETTRMIMMRKITTANTKRKKKDKIQNM